MSEPEKTFFVAIRENADGRLWIDLNTWSYLRDEVTRNAEKNDATIPAWAAENPVIRIGHFKISEIP